VFYRVDIQVKSHIFVEFESLTCLPL